jgi:hypothetical protein
MATHIERALMSFQDDMTKKDLIKHCATYISSNPDIQITPGWFAQLMMDDCVLLSKRKNRIKGSKAFTWLNVHKLDGKYRGRLIL